MKVKNEKEIDEIVIAQADDETAWTNIQVVKNRAKCGSREKFLIVLSKILKVEPKEKDKINELKSSLS